MAKMGFEEAKRIRGKSLSNRIAGRLVGGEGFGSSISKSISEGSKARMTGLREKINPMNIAKFMTGGSNLAAALTGRITGASKENMKYFTGKSGSTTVKNDTTSKIKPLMDQQEGMFDMLETIHKLLVDIREKRDADKPTEETISEKQRNDERRHRELIEAISGKKVSNKNIPQNESKGLFDDIFDGFNLKINPGRAAAKAGAGAAAKAGADAATKAGADAATKTATKETIKKSATKQLGKSIGKGALKSIPILGLAIGAGFAIGRLIEGDVVGAGIDVASGVGSALTAIPLTLTNAARDVYKEVYGNYPDPTNSKDQENLAEIYSVTKAAAAELLKNSAVPVENDIQYDALGTAMQGVPMSEEASPKTKTPSPSASPASATTPSLSATPASATTPSLSATPASPTTPSPSATLEPKATNKASPMESTPSSAAVGTVTSQNLDMNLPTNQNIKSDDLVNETVIKNQTTTTINSQNQDQQDTTIMPSVRNMEETFKRMTLYSTHVV